LSFKTTSFIFRERHELKQISQIKKGCIAAALFDLFEKDQLSDFFLRYTLRPAIIAAHRPISTVPAAAR